MTGMPHVKIQESVEELKGLLQEQRNVRDYKRIQALYLLKSGQCQHIQDVAEHIGHHRSCIHRWLQQYQQDGIPGLLDPGQCRGRKQHIPLDIQSKLKTRLAQPRGFGSYREIQQWLASQYGLEVGYMVVYRTVRYRLKAKLKTPRPVHPQQDPEEVDTFVFQLPESIERLASHFPNTRMLRYWCEDETRMGLRSIVRDRITLMGIQPVLIQQAQFSCFWLYGWVEPKTGEHFMWEFSHLDSWCFEYVLHRFSESYPHQFHLIQLDNSAAHRAKDLSIPEHIKLLFQPPYAPQLNPIERLWRFIKDKLANRQWFDLEELRSELEFHLRYLSPQVVQSLTGWDFILDALSVAGF